MSEQTFPGRRIWDLPVRWFHWINVLLVLCLLALGTLILNAKAFGLTNDGKVLLKTLHAYVGYAFVFNLAVRLIWAFIGGQNARWRSLLPSMRDLKQAFGDQLPNILNARGHRYIAHSPLGKLSIALMLLCMLLMAVTGLTLAGTDLFLPPLGGWVAESIAAAGVDPASLAPYRPELLDEQAYAAMRAWRSTFIELHEFGFYALLVLVPLHLAGVVLAELHSAGGLVSAMITGRRFIRDENVNRAPPLS